MAPTNKNEQLKVDEVWELMSEEKRQLFDDLGLTNYYPRKITIQEARRHVTNTVGGKKDIPWCFIEKVLVLDYKGRTVYEPPKKAENFLDMNSNLEDLTAEKPTANDIDELCFHDVVVAVYLCCDYSLKKLLAHKLQMSHISIPFVLPDVADERKLIIQMSTYRGMRDLPSFAHCSAMLVSFLNVNKGATSTSALLNILLCDESHDTFYDNSWDKNNASKESILSDSLIDITSFIKSECICPPEKCSCLFKKSILFLNCYGASRHYKDQQNFICSVSNLVVMLVELGNILDINVIDNIKEIVKDSRETLIVFTKDHISGIQECLTNWKRIREEITNDRDHSKVPKVVFLFDTNADGRPLRDREIKEKMQSSISKIAEEGEDVSFLDPVLRRHVENVKNITSDEDVHDYKIWKQRAQDIEQFVAENIKNFKDKLLPLQGELWQKWSKIERDIRSKIPEGDESTEVFAARLKATQVSLRTQQVDAFSRESNKVMRMFYSTICELQGPSRSYFIEYLTSSINDVSSKAVDNFRKKLNRLKGKKEGKEKALGDGKEANSRYMSETKKLEEDINNAYIGIKHFFREAAQTYEAIRSQEDKRLLKLAENLSRVVAELFMEGFPLEIVDCTAKQVPMMFIESVLGYVEKLIDSKVFILSVLGIQSSGKSTLLNAMFGTQFSTSVGMCTDGVNAQLIPIPSHIHSGEYEYIILIDTKGLRSTDRDMLSDSHSWDNEIATLLFGISDLTMVNMKGESKAEVDDILQVVINALLKIKKVNRDIRLEPKCLFVHQNVHTDEVGALEKLELENRNFKEKLDKVTSSVIERVGVDDITSFDDLIKFCVVTDFIYYPNLWHGNPPLTTVNDRYSQKVRKVRDMIFDQIINVERFRFSIGTFSTRLKDVWEAIISDDFIFCFRNQLQINSFVRLENVYNQLQSRLNQAKFQTLRKLNTMTMTLDTTTTFPMMTESIVEAYDKAKKELDDFFVTDDGRLLSEWNFRYQTMLTHLKDEKIDAAKRALSNEIKIQTVQNENEARLNQWKEQARRKAVNRAMQKLKTDAEMNVSKKGRRKPEINDAERNAEIDKEFKELWEELKQSVPMPDVKNENIESLVANVLREMGRLNLLQTEGMDLSFTEEEFSIKSEHFFTNSSPSFSESERLKFREKIENITLKIVRDVENYMDLIKEDVFSKSHVQQTAMIVLGDITKWNNEDTQLKLTDEYKISMLKYTASYAVVRFKRMQEAFMKKVDIRGILEEFQAEINTRFIDIIHEISIEETESTLLCEEVRRLTQDMIGKELIHDLPDEIKDYYRFMESKSKFMIQILRDLLTNDSIEEYKNFLDFTEEYCTTSLNKYINLYLFYKSTNNQHRFYKKVNYVAREIVQKARDIIVKNAPSSSGSNNLKTWLDILTSDLTAVFPDIKKSTNHIKDRFKQSNRYDTGMFYNYLKNGVNQIPNSLEETYKQMTKLQPNVEKAVFNKLMDLIGCTNKCPFCRCLCSLGHGHVGECYTPKHHPAFSVHYANGDDLCISTCNILVGSDKKFFLKECKKVKFSTFRCFINFIYPFGDYYTEDVVPFRRYKEAYEEWNIDVDKSLDVSPYWMRFVSKFKEELAAHYGKKSPVVPSQWSGIKKVVADMSLEA